MRYIFLSLIFLFLIGCSDPVIDTSSDATMKSSIAKVKEALPTEKRTEFDKAIKYLLFSQIDMKSIFRNAFEGKQVDQQDIQEDMKKVINGKTGLQVIEEAKKLKEQREAEKKSKEIKEFNSLKDKQIQANIQKEKLKGLKVIKTSYKVKEFPFVGKVAKIKATVTNNTHFPISSVHFDGKLVSEGRSVPWEEDELFEIIKGGIEPDETKELELIVHSASMRAWTSDEIPSDAKVMLEVTKIFGPDKKELFGSDFSEYDEKRLIELKNKYDVQTD